MDEEFVALADLAAWEQFYSANREALEELASKEHLFRAACNQSLMIGGGASPLFCVGFVD
jgi:hypothetical protein